MQMKKVMTFFVTVFILVFGTSAIAGSTDGVVPYVGADAKWYHMPFKKGFGDNLTESNYPQANGFLGIKLNNFVGVEAGYEVAASKTRNATESDGGTYFGVAIPSGTGALNAVTETKIHGFNVNLVGFLPVSEEYALDLIGSIGLARLKLDITNNLPSLAVQEEKFSQEKWVPRLSLGLQHMLAKQFGVRATVGWEKTSSFDNLVPTDAPGSTLIAKVKDSTSVGFGLFYNFK